MTGNGNQAESVSSLTAAGFLFFTGDLRPTCQPGHIAKLAKQEIVMTLEVRLLSAFVRKVDIAKHYPGGCPEFEQRHVLGNSDTQLYSLVAMSPKDLEASLQDIVSAGFQADQFCAVADMWHGPIQSVPTIQFHCQADTFPPVWFASAAGETAHG